MHTVTGDEAPRKESGLFVTSVMSLALVLTMGSSLSFASMLPRMVDLWSLGAMEAGWIGGAYYGGYTAAVAVLVALTDRVDPKRIWLVGASASALGSLMFAAVAGGTWTAAACHAVIGVGLAGTYMPGMRLLTDHVPASTRARAQAAYTASYVLGLSLSVAEAGWLSELLSWRAAFLMAGIQAAVGFLLVLLLAPGRVSVHGPGWRELADIRPVIRSGPCVGHVLAYGAHQWESSALKAWFAGLAGVLVMQAGAGETVAMPATSVTDFVALAILLSVPGTLVCNELALKLGRRRVLVGTAALALLVAMPLVSWQVPAWAGVVLMGAWCVLAISDGATLTIGTTETAPSARRGTALALHSLFGFTCASAAPVAVGGAIDLVGGLASPLALPAGCLVMALGSVLGPAFVLTLGQPRGTAARMARG